MTIFDFTAVTELPGSRLNAEQMARICQRYALGASLAAGRRVLEVACGAGIGLGVVAAGAQQLVGCDLTYGVLAMARRHYGRRIPLLSADAQTLPFADASFDLILSFEAIYYLPRLDHFLRESRRILAPHGQLLIGTSNPDWPHFVPGTMSVDYPDLAALNGQLRAAGFARCQAYGALPVSAQTTPRQMAAAHIRKLLRSVPLLTGDTVVARVLKRLAYGRLVALPAALDPQSLAVAAPFADLTPIPPDQRDHRHRVLFVLAER